MGNHFQQGNSANYTIGGVRFWFNERLSESPERYRGFVDMGNVQEAPSEQAVEMLDHYTTKTGTKRKDRTLVKQVDETMTIKFDEPNADNLRMFLRGGSISDIAAGIGTKANEIMFLQGNDTRILGEGYAATAITVTDLSGNVDFVLNTDYEVVDVLGGFKGIKRKGTSAIADDSSKTGTVAGAKTALDTTVVLDAVGGTYAPAAGDILKVPTTNELLLVTGQSGTTPNFTLTVERGYAGTSASVIADNAVLTLQNVTGSKILDNSYVAVGYSYTIRAAKRFAPTTQMERKGQALFFGVSDTGNEFIRSIALCQLEPDGSFSMATDDWTAFSIKLTVLDNSDIVPSAPYGLVNHYGVGTDI